MTEKILACPYCGGEDVGFSDEEQHPHYDWVWCHDCSAEGPPAETKIEAIEKWNAAANALRKKDEEIAKQRAMMHSQDEALADAQDKRDEYYADWYAEHRRVAAGDKRQDELEAEIEKLRKERDAVIDRAAKAILALDELEKLYKTVDAEVDRVCKERDEAIAKRDMMERHSNQDKDRILILESKMTIAKHELRLAEEQRDEARAVARRLYDDNQLKDGDIIRLCEEIDKRPILKIARELDGLDNLTRLEKLVVTPTDTNLNTRYQFWYDARSDTGYIVDTDGNYRYTVNGKPNLIY